MDWIAMMRCNVAASDEYTKTQRPINHNKKPINTLALGPLDLFLMRLYGVFLVIF